MKFIVWVLVSWLNIGRVTAQDIEPINTDRPDQSDGTYILKTKKIQIENGLYIDSVSLINNLMMRTGLTESAELRLVVNAGSFQHATGLFPIGIGIKQRILHTNKRKYIPALTLSGYYYFGDGASKSFKTNQNSYNFIIAFQNDINDQWSIGYNIGTTDFNKSLNYTTSFCFSPIKKTIFFLEYFGYFKKNNRPLHNTDAGVLYQLKPNFQLDLAFGMPLGHNEVNTYVTGGFSWRFNI